MPGQTFSLLMVTEIEANWIGYNIIKIKLRASMNLWLEK